MEYCSRESQMKSKIMEVEKQIQTQQKHAHRIKQIQSIRAKKGNSDFDAQSATPRD